MSIDKNLTEAEKILRERFDSTQPSTRIQSTAGSARTSPRVNAIVLPDHERGKMPFTKSKYLVKENPHLVEWEREVRKFLRNLSPEHGHRVSATMIWEWATGLKVADVIQIERKRQPGTSVTYRADLRNLNRVLKFYFGTPYATWICGRKVPKAYAVPPGYYIKRHRPMTLTLYAEYTEGVLNP